MHSIHGLWIQMVLMLILVLSVSSKVTVDKLLDCSLGTARHNIHELLLSWLSRRVQSGKGRLLLSGDRDSKGGCSFFPQWQRGKGSACTTPHSLGCGVWENGRQNTKILHRNNRQGPQEALGVGGACSHLSGASRKQSFRREMRLLFQNGMIYFTFFFSRCRTAFV